MENTKITLKQIKKLKKKWGTMWSATEHQAYKRISKAFAAKKEMEADVVADSVLRLGLTSLKKDLSFLQRLLGMLGWKEPATAWLKASTLAKAKNVTYKKRSTVFPSSIEFKTSIEELLCKNKFQEVLFLAMVLASGRRGVEVQRLMVEDLDWVDDELVARLPWSKTSVKPVVFKVQLDLVAEWLEPELEVARLKASLGKMMKGTGKLFKDNIHKNIGRSLKGFNLHSLRSVAAVFMILNGSADSTIMRQLGWADARMLLRYVRMAPEVLKGQTSVDAAMMVVKKFAD